MKENFFLTRICILGNGETSMKIKKMTIDNICGIIHLNITFNDGLNLICGENGVGKTTILRSITHQFLHGNDSFIKKHYNTEKGTVCIILDNEQHLNYEVQDFIPGDIHTNTYNHDESNNLLYFSSKRTIDYFKIDALPAAKNTNTDNNSFFHSSSLLTLGIDGEKIKNWFVNLYVFSNIEDSLTQYQKNNLELCKNLFNLLDEKLDVKTVRADYEIVLNQKNNEIYFEMLSDGYKSCIFILLGIIKEVDYRYPRINAIDFNGIILIDEIDIHLHPQWQAKLVKVLKQVFPKAQIIATTHSPSVLQNAKAEEIIPLYKDENDNIYIKQLNLGEYGLQGWTLEEILQDVMGMPFTTSELYAQTIKEFDEAMFNEDITVVKEAYKKLDKMLHPNSTLRRLLQIQMAGMEV